MTSDGRLWFMTARGVTIMNPASSISRAIVTVHRRCWQMGAIHHAAVRAVAGGDGGNRLHGGQSNVSAKTRFRDRLGGSIRTDRIDAWVYKIYRRVVRLSSEHDRHARATSAAQNDGDFRSRRCSIRAVVLRGDCDGFYFFGLAWQIRPRKVRKEFALSG